MKRILILLTSLIGFCLSASAETLDLQAFLQTVQENNKTLQQAVRDQDLARAKKREAIAGALPKIGAEAGYTRNLSDYYMYFDMAALNPQATGVAKAPIKRDNEYSATVALQQTLFSSTVGAAIKAAKQYEHLSSSVYQATEQAVLTGAKKLFYQCLLLEQVWQVRQSAEQNAQENYEQMQLKFENGQISEFELVQAETRWRGAVPETRQAERNYRVALNMLKTLAGLPLDAEIELQGGFDTIPELPSDQSTASVLDARPDFQALEWQQKLYQTQVTATKGSFLPSLTGTVAYAYSAQSNEWKRDEENNLWFAGVTLSWPLYTGGTRRSLLQQAKIEQQKSLLALDEKRDEISTQLLNLHLQLNEARERIESAQATRQAAEKAFKIATISAQNGLATQLQLKDTRVAFDGALLNWYAARYDYLAAYFDWQQATGSVRANN